MTRGNAPLPEAIWNDDIEMVKLLVSYGANLDRYYYDNRYGQPRTPLQLSIVSGLPMIKLLLENGASVSYNNCCALRFLLQVDDVDNYLIEFVHYIPKDILLRDFDNKPLMSSSAKRIFSDEIDRRK